MANYYVVFDEQVEGSSMEVGTEFNSDKSLDKVKTARVLQVEASSVLKAQQFVEHFFPGEVTGTPVVVTEAQWKTS